MNGEPLKTAEEKQGRNKQASSSLGPFQDWRTLAWPAIAAVLAAICNFFGYVSESGEWAALGVYHLSRPTISEGYIIGGAMTLRTLMVGVVLVAIVAIGLYAFGRLISRRLSNGIQTRLAAIPKSAAWGWIVVIAAFVTSGLGMILTNDLMRDADSMILKSGRELGTAWLRMSLDQDRDWENGYLLMQAAIITIFVALSWWILARFFTSAAPRAVYGTWAMVQLFVLLTGFAFFVGAASTVQPYPIVAFSNMYQLLEKDTAAILVGSDDKVYAFLLVFKVGPRNETPGISKAILYLPRTEVKWLTVLRQEPFRNVVLYHDLKPPLAVVPTISEPVSDAPIPGISRKDVAPSAPSKAK
jgi:hypothetical protein